MTDKGKTKAQLIDEVVALRQQVADLRAELSRTERTRAEEALQGAAAELAEWKGRYEAAVQATGQVLYDWNSQTDAVLWSGNLEQMLGYALDELPTTLAEAMALVHPADRAALDQEIVRTRNTKSDAHLTYRLRRKDGAYITVEDKGHFFMDRAGTITRMVGFLVDITERKRMEEALRESEERFSKAFHANPAPLSINTSDGHLLKVNTQFLALFGYRRHEVIGRTSLESWDYGPIPTIGPTSWRHWLPTGYCAIRNTPFARNQESAVGVESEVGKGATFRVWLPQGR